MQSGTECKIGGQYCCLYHLKRKIKLTKGDTFPVCNFAGLNCEGYWHLLKEIKEKTFEERQEAQNRRRQAQDKRRTFGNDYHRKLTDAKPSKWSDDKW